MLTATDQHLAHPAGPHTNTVVKQAAPNGNIAVTCLLLATAGATWTIGSTCTTQALMSLTPHMVS